MGLSFAVPGVESGKPTYFTVLTKGAGKAAVDASFSSPVKDFDVIDNYDYSQTVKYTPTKQVLAPFKAKASARLSVCLLASGRLTGFNGCLRLQGELTITVTFGGDPIAKSPFTVGVAAPLDLSKVNVDDLDGRE